MGAYDYEPYSASADYLQLKDKNQSVNIRLVSEPVVEVKVWKEGEKAPIDQERISALTDEQLDQVRREKDTDGKNKYRVAEQFSWVVLDRDDGSTAKIFTGTQGVYKKIKALAQNTKWGDPTKYDLTVTRTEQPGPSYYEVTADPDKSELTADEQERADEVDLLQVKKYAKPTVVTEATTEKSNDALDGLDEIPGGADSL